MSTREAATIFWLTFVCLYEGHLRMPVEKPIANDNQQERKRG